MSKLNAELLEKKQLAFDEGVQRKHLKEQHEGLKELLQSMSLELEKLRKHTMVYEDEIKNQKFVNINSTYLVT